MRRVAISAICACACACTNHSEDKVEPLYNIVPDIRSCSAGEVSQEEKNKVLVYVNKLREAYGLPAVEYDKSRDAITQKAALLGASKATVDETPSSDDECYVPDASAGWGASVLSLWGSASSKWTTSDVHINDFLMEKGRSDLKRRRALLNPFLSKISFGRVIGTPRRGDYQYVSVAALHVKSDDADLSEKNIPEIVAFPRGVCEAKFLDLHLVLNFSVVSNKLARANNTADFSNATVEVLAGSQPATVSDVEYDNLPEGLPNNLQWKVNGLNKGITYTVRITNVVIDDESKDYEYTFSFK
ncbi:MAG: CAP domain-containing protein [Prevotellaceae bacterium]|jgi:hypothetical protein|nr:CAP domain-containing protein [Prevotellaceae bacterium]